MNWSDFGVNPGRKALTISIVLGLLGHISGSFAIINYTATIFKKSGSILSANESALVIGIVQLVGVVIMLPLVERVGRKVNEIRFNLVLYLHWNEFVLSHLFHSN